MHQAGRYADAARRYHSILEWEPDHADALHLFGVLHHQNGYHARAVELLSRAVALRPEAVAFHANLAEAHRALGQHQQAIDCCQAALRLQPNYPEAATNLGLALHDLGRYEEAVAQFRAALEMRSELATAQNNLGTSLLKLGQDEEAIEAFRAAIKIDPQLARAHSNLGQMLIDQGEAEQGLALCLEAVRLDPRLPAGHNNLGNAYRALKRWDEAHAAYDAAQQLAPDLARVHANRGLALHVEGRPRLAFICFRRATELAPDDAEMWRYLGNAYVAEEEYAAARPCWERIVALEPAQPGGHVDLGGALQEEGRFDEAAASYRRALELAPRHLGAILSQGGLHEELGEMAEAEVCYRRARSVHPWAPGPLSRLAVLLRGKLPEDDLRALEDRVARMGPGAWARGHALFGLAHVLDARGDYDQAAACLTQANALALEERKQQARHYDAADHEAFIDRLIAGLTPDLFHRLAGAGDDSCQPVFVFGMPRSGTTLTEQVLASHSRVHGAGELGLAAQGFRSIPFLPDRDDHAKDWDRLDAALVEKQRQLLLADLRATIPASWDSQHPPDRIVDKLPDNYLFLGLLAVLFPRATFIHVRRDLRDVAVSCWMTNFRSIRWANDFASLAGRCHGYRRLMAHWKAVLPVPVHEVVYERLVDDFEPEARRLVAACGLEWEPACLAFHETKRPVRTASITQVRQPLYRQALARWKHYETALADLFARLPDCCTQPG